jgi:hypothetical protein
LLWNYLGDWFMVVEKDWRDKEWNRMDKEMHVRLSENWRSCPWEMRERGGNVILQLISRTRLWSEWILQYSDQCTCLIFMRPKIPVPTWRLVILTEVFHFALRPGKSLQCSYIFNLPHLRIDFPTADFNYHSVMGSHQRYNRLGSTEW